jgi:hypothetical protein
MCYRETAALANLRVADLTDDKPRLAAAENLPDQWRNFCLAPNHKNDPADVWKAISKDRIWEVYYGRKRKQGHQCGVSFSKAVLAVLALEEAVRLKGSPIDIYEYVHIAPAIYHIDGFDSSSWDKLSAKEKHHLKRSAYQKDWHCISDLLDRRESRHRPVTYQTALNLKNGLKDIGVEATVELSQTHLGCPSKSIKPNHKEFKACAH